MAEQFGLVLVPSTSHSPDATSSADDLVAQRERDGWQLVSSRVDQYGAEVMVFRRLADVGPGM